MTGIPDLHCHLDKFGDKLPDLVAEWERAGVSRVMTVGMDVPSCQAAIEIAERYPAVIACAGLHPWEFENAYRDEGDLQAYAELAAHPSVSVISEVGLDAGVALPMEDQKRILGWFLRLGRELERPVVMHQKATCGDMLEVLDGLDGDRPVAAIHSVGGARQDFEEYAAHGLYLSVGPSSLDLLGDPLAEDDAVRAIPDDRLLVDSDAFPAFDPWPEVRPAAVVDVVERLAGLRGTTPDDLTAQIRANFERFSGTAL